MWRVREELANSIEENLPFEFFDLIFNYVGDTAGDAEEEVMGLSKQ